MAHFLYIIESEKTGDLYKGVTQNPSDRLAAHNAGLSQFTKSGFPWKLVFLRTFTTKEEALKEEKRLKKCNRKYLDWLIRQPLNELLSS